jgi:hypothetical protein
MVLNIINYLPFRKKIIYLIKKILFFYHYRIKTLNVTKKDIKPYKIYWISPEKIAYHTNYLKENSNIEATPIAHRVFPENMRGMIINGDWDISPYLFTKLGIYESIFDRYNGKEWKDTNFYKHFLNMINKENTKTYWGIITEKDLIERCNFIDSLIDEIKNNGYVLSINKLDNLYYDEVEVNISRNGEYYFQNGRHRLSISKILQIKKIPVLIFVRHREWQNHRSYILNSSKRMPGNKFLINLIHPDLDHINYDKNSDIILENLSSELSIKNKKILDLNPLTGYFDHKFEEMGYECVLYDNNKNNYSMMKILKKYKNKNFKIYNNLNSKFITDFNPDIILYLFTDNNYDEDRINFLKKQLLNNKNLKEIYLQNIDSNNKKLIMDIVNQIKKESKFDKYKIIYEKDNIYTYKIFY